MYVKAVNERYTPMEDGMVREDVVRLLSGASGGICNPVHRGGNQAVHRLAFCGFSSFVDFIGVVTTRLAQTVTIHTYILNMSHTYLLSKNSGIFFFCTNI